jgi:outer membrane protein assembly factor BamD
MIRMAMLAVLALVLPGWTQPGDSIRRFAENAETAEKTLTPDQQADREMEIGRQLIHTSNYTGALNRFKNVMTRNPTSPHVEEALGRLTEIYLALGIAGEAQTLVAVLARKFPDGRWSAQARDALKAAGLEPHEDERSWISRAVK